MKKFFSLILALVTVVAMSLILNRAEAQVMASLNLPEYPICTDNGSGEAESSIINSSTYDPSYEYKWRFTLASGFIESAYGYDVFSHIIYNLPIGTSTVAISLKIYDEDDDLVASTTGQISYTRVETPIFSIEGSTIMPEGMCYADQLHLATNAIYDSYEWSNQTLLSYSTFNAEDIINNNYLISLKVMKDGCKASNMFAMQIYYPPMPPTVISSPEGCNLASSWNYDYVDVQWFNEETPLGIYGQYYNPTTPGWYVAEASNNNGCRSKSNPVWSSCSVAGFEDSEISETEVYPNPFDSELNVSLPNDGQLHSVQLINILGEVVTEVSGYGELKIQRKNLLPGIYFVRTDSGRSIKVTAQ